MYDAPLDLKKGDVYVLCITLRNGIHIEEYMDCKIEYDEKYDFFMLKTTKMEIARRGLLCYDDESPSSEVLVRFKDILHINTISKKTYEKYGWFNDE